VPRILAARLAVDEVDPRGDPPLLRQRRQEQAVAAVVARAAQHLQQPGLRPAQQQFTKGGTGGPRHEYRSRQAMLLDGAAVHGAALRRAVQPGRLTNSHRRVLWRVSWRWEH
jgi:hypothetical protein